MKYILLLLFCFSSCSLLAQYRIKIHNPSFELDNAQIGVITQGWFNCGERNTSPPDLHSGETSFFSVRENAAHGNNYISIIARSNNTWESIGQRLVKPLDKYKIHHIAFRTKHSRTLRVYNTSNHNSERYNQPISIRMWAGNTPGSKKEYLGSTEALNFKNWNKVNILFRPSRSYRYICFDAAYVSDDGSPYNGNVLLDKFSPISIVTDTVRYKPVCVNSKVLKVIDEKLINEKELIQLATNYIALQQENGASLASLPTKLSAIAQVNTFMIRMKIGGRKKYFYTEKSARLKAVVQALYAIEANAEANVIESYLALEENFKNDHFTRKAARKLSKQYAKVEQSENFLLDYIKTNRAQILDEFIHCEMLGGIKM